VLLNVNPVTDLIGPTTPLPTTPPGLGTALRQGPLTTVIVRSAARYLGISPKRLRAQLSAGVPLQQIARLHGTTVKLLRRAVLTQLDQQVRGTLR
jgi:hypothetical protein